MASMLAYAATESAKAIGMPEAAIPLANVVVTLATAPKSNTSYVAYHRALEDITSGLGNSIPKHLQSPNFEGYLYPHDYENNYVKQTYLPADVASRHYYNFGNNKTEQAAKAYHDFIVNNCKNGKKV
jgi:putative ATPase